MPRRCKDWLQTFKDFSLPRTEAPEQYVLWTGLFTIAATLERKVWIPKEGVLGGWDCYPHLYLKLIGPPGFRKTTAMEAFGIPLLEQVTPTLTKGPAFVTKEALLQQLVNSERKALYLTITEFGDIMQKNGPEMYDFLTSMFDGKKSIESRTISRSIEFALKPCINMLAATTPQWMATSMPMSAIGGGYASRVIFVYAEKLSRRQMYYRHIDHLKIQQMEADLVNDLSHIASTLSGPYNLTDESFEFMEHWYQKIHPEHAPHPKIEGYWQRKPTHVHKVAMLHAAMSRDEMMLHKEDFEFAIKMLDSTEPDLLRVFGGVGKNIHSFDMSDISEYVRARGKVSMQETFKEFNAVAQPHVLKGLIDGCIIMGDIDCIQEGLEIYYVKPGFVEIK